MIYFIIIFGTLITIGVYKDIKEKRNKTKNISLSSECPSCKTELKNNTLFCTNCGLDMNHDENEEINSMGAA